VFLAEVFRTGAISASGDCSHWNFETQWELRYLLAEYFINYISLIYEIFWNGKGNVQIPSAVAPHSL